MHRACKVRWLRATSFNDECWAASQRERETFIHFCSRLVTRGNPVLRDIHTSSHRLSGTVFLTSSTHYIFLLSIHITNYRIKQFYTDETFQALFLKTPFAKALIYQNTDRYSEEHRCLDSTPITAKSCWGWHRSFPAALNISRVLTEWLMGPSHSYCLFISLQEGGRRDRQKAGWETDCSDATINLEWD